MLILSYFEYTTEVKISDNETAFEIVASGLQGLRKMKPFIIILSAIPFAYVQEK